jgi:hypothetical protein
MKRTGLILGAVFSAVLLSTDLAFSQEQAPADSEMKLEPDIQWLWGEVVSLDAAKGELSVKYLDYESDQEKEIMIATDSSTTYEGGKSFADIKPKDTLSIDYTLTPNGKNTAKNINIESSEVMQPWEGAISSEPASQPVANLTAPTR